MNSWSKFWFDLLDWVASNLFPPFIIGALLLLLIGGMYSLFSGPQAEYRLKPPNGIAQILKVLQQW